MPNRINITSPTTVISLPRSGTTLIAEIFKLHPAFNSVGETGNLICDSWHSVEFSRGVTIPTIENKQILLTKEKAGRIVRQTFLTLFPDDKQEWFQKPIGVPKVLSNKFDESQWDEAAEWYWSVYEHSFPNAKLFTLLRHPCDVVLSTAKHLGFDPASTWWTLGFMSYLLTHPACPIDYAVHYEELIENQEEVIKELFNYLGIKFDSAVIQAFSTVHIPSRGRENINANFSSRHSEWPELDPSIINPYYVEQIDKLFKKFNHKIDWPEHFQTFKQADNKLSNPRKNKSLYDVNSLHETIDRLNRNIESIHLDYSTKQIKLNHDINQANQRAEAGWQTAHNLQKQIDGILNSRAGRWLTIYWAAADKIKGFAQSIRSQDSNSPATDQPSTQAQQISTAAKTIKQHSLSINLEKEKSAVFVLPSGFTLGGVTSWSIEMVRRLIKQNRPATLVKYKNIGSELNLTQQPVGQIINCDGPQIPASQEVIEFAVEYAKALPGTVIPNYNHRTYAVCTTIAQNHANALRVIGYAHTDEDSYYALLWFYESIIHRFVAVSDEIGEKLGQLIPHRSKDIVVRPYGVAVSSELIRTYSTGDQPLQITYAGRISIVQKRILDLIPLAQYLEQLEVNFQLNIVGNGSDKSELQRRIWALSPAIQNRISLKEQIAPEKMADLWENSDVCILVSEYEGTSISLLESMAHGCVPIVTEVSGVQAVLTNGENGFFVPIGQIDKLAHRIKQLDENRKQLTDMGRQAHQTILKHFSYDDYLKWFTELMTTVWQEKLRAWPQSKPVMTDWKTMQALGTQLTQRFSTTKHPN